MGEEGREGDRMKREGWGKGVGDEGKKKERKGERGRVGKREDELCFGLLLGPGSVVLL